MENIEQAEKLQKITPNKKKCINLLRFCVYMYQLCKNLSFGKEKDFYIMNSQRKTE